MIAYVDRVPVEIQLRTRIQDVWAQAMERLADELGRDIRYGWVPEQGGERLRYLLDISNSINDIEEIEREHPRLGGSTRRFLSRIRSRLKKL